MVQAMHFDGKTLDILDQTKLPLQVEWVHCSTEEQVADCILTMKVRGAPAIGAAPAYGCAIAALRDKSLGAEAFQATMEHVLQALLGTRPTAVNLAWAIDRIKKLLHEPGNPAQWTERILQEAKQIASDDLQINRQIGENGVQVIPPNAHILTHYNTGTLATVGYGTALGVIRS